MRVVIINSVYKIGSTGKIVSALNKYLTSKGIDSLVLYGRGKKSLESNAVKLSFTLETLLHVLLSRITGVQGVFSFFSTLRIISSIKKFKPDVVHLFNLHGYYLNEFMLFEFLKKNDINIVYTMVDEYPYAGRCCYPYDCEKFTTSCKACPQVKAYPKSYYFDSSSYIFKKKKFAYQNLDNAVFTGPEWVIGRAKQSALLKTKKMKVIDEFIDTETVFFPRQVEKLRADLRINPDLKVLLNVCPFSDSRKGAIHYLEMAKRITDEKILFIHVGFDGELGCCPKNFMPIPYVSNVDELATYYSLADVLVCTSLADTMPNVCLQALACGTPVIGFEGGGTKYTTNQELGQFVVNGDVEALSELVRRQPRKSSHMIERCIEYAQSRYSVNAVCDKFLLVYDELNNSKKQLNQ